MNQTATTAAQPLDTLPNVLALVENGTDMIWYSAHTGPLPQVCEHTAQATTEKAGRYEATDEFQPGEHGYVVYDVTALQVNCPRVPFNVERLQQLGEFCGRFRRAA